MDFFFADKKVPAQLSRATRNLIEM